MPSSHEALHRILRWFRLFTFIACGVLTALTGMIGVLATVWSPLNPATTAHFQDGIVAATIVAIIAIVTVGVIDHIERERNRQEREINNRRLAEMHAQIFGEAARSTVVATATAPTRLREAAMQLAKNYRDFANSAGANSDVVDIMKDFWAKYPFKELDDIKGRLKNQPGMKCEVESSAEHLPMNPDNIRKIADALEREALRVPEDALL